MLVVADGPLLEEIIDGTRSLWDEGMGRAGYAAWNAAQLQTPWGRTHLQRLALVDDDGRLLASAKRYRFRARLAGREVGMCGIGALFTPIDRRGQGHARRLLRELLDGERRAGVEVAALFSEIGLDYYSALGFEYVPVHEVTVRVKAGEGAPAMLVRGGDERDFHALAAMHAVRTADAGFALARDRALVQYAITKKRMLAGLGPAGVRQVEYFVAEEGASAVAYVVLLRTANGWTLEDAGDRDPAGARLGAMLRVLLAREPSHTQPLIRAWWPASFPVPPQIDLVDTAPAHDLLMLRMLDGSPLPPEARDVFYWHIDHF